ncbi:MAG: hypothetical protein ABI333_08475 [bacterium]
MRRGDCLALVGALLILGGTPVTGCKSPEAQKVREAYEEVVDYSLEYKRKHTVWQRKKLPGYVWAVRENRDNPKRPTLDVDIAIPNDLSNAELRKMLKEAARTAKAATALGVVRVQAWPQGLIAFGGIYGTAHLAQDGRGWDGQGNTFRGVQVISGHGKGLRRPSMLDVEILLALESRRRILLTDPKNENRKAYWLRRSTALEEALVAEVAPQLGFTRASVWSVVRNARKYWWKPGWQPSPVGASQ